MSETTLTIWMQVVVWFLLITMTVFLPLFRRKPVSFGIALPADKLKEPAVLRIRNQYMVACAILGAVGFLLGMALIARDGGGGSTFTTTAVGLPFCSILVSTLLYIRGNRLTAKLKAERGWQVPEPRFVAVDTAFRQDSGAISMWWFLIPLGLIALEAGILAAMYDHIPDILNVHYKGNVVDRTEPKSVKIVFLPTVIQALVVALLAGVTYTIKLSKQELDPNDLEGSRARSRKLRRNGTLMVWGISLLTTIEFGLIQLGLIGWLDSTAVTAIAVISPLAFIGFAIALTARMSLLTTNSSTYGTPVNDDRYWKSGLFYYNPNDPAVFVEKRVGIGWTVNLGRPLGWVALLSPLLLVLIILIVAQL